MYKVYFNVSGIIFCGESSAQEMCRNNIFKQLVNNQEQCTKCGKVDSYFLSDMYDVKTIESDNLETLKALYT